MYYLDRTRDRDGSEIYRVKSNFDLPLKRSRDGSYKIPAGEVVHVCLTSDFFLEEADDWRDAVWDMIRVRSDLRFELLTKRAHRIRACLPSDWGDGWEHVKISVTAENQARAEERVPLLLEEVPARHKGVMVAPFLGPVDLRPYLVTGQLENVLADGENYEGARPCHYEWVADLFRQCREADVPFSFVGTGNVFVKDGKTYHICKAYQHTEALLSGLQYPPVTHPVTLQRRCAACPRRDVCGGCKACGKC